MRRYSFLLGIGGILILFQGIAAFGNSSFCRAVINDFRLVHAGEYWRLFTAQFIHLDWIHLSVDVTCLFVVGSAVWKHFSQTRLLITILVSGTLGQFAAYLAWVGGLTNYNSLVGSSDALHGLAYLWIAQVYASSPKWRERLLPLGIFALILASVIYTCFTGEMIISEDMKSPGYNHLGGILGFMAALEFGFLQMKRIGPHE